MLIKKLHFHMKKSAFNAVSLLEYFSVSADTIPEFQY